MSNPRRTYGNATVTSTVAVPRLPVTVNELATRRFEGDPQFENSPCPGEVAGRAVEARSRGITDHDMELLEAYLRTQF